MNHSTFQFKGLFDISCSINIVMFSECCNTNSMAMKAVHNFLKSARKETEKKVDLVFFSNAEKFLAYQEFGKQMHYLINQSVTYEDSIKNPDQMKAAMDKKQWIATEWALKLRQLFSGLSKNNCKLQNFRKFIHIKDLDYVKQP